MAAAALCPAQQEAHQLHGMSLDVTAWMLQDVQQGSFGLESLPGAHLVHRVEKHLFGISPKLDLLLLSMPLHNVDVKAGRFLFLLFLPLIA